MKSFGVETRIGGRWCALQGKYDTCGQAEVMRTLICHPTTRVTVDVVFGDSIFTVPLTNWESSSALCEERWPENEPERREPKEIWPLFETARRFLRRPEGSS